MGKFRIFFSPDLLAGSTRKSPLIIMCTMNYYDYEYDYPENLKPKYLKMSEMTLHIDIGITFFGSIVEELTCQLLALAANN